jgi:hypothetical protein
MSATTQVESNIFGDTVISHGSATVETNNETTAAGKLIEHLKFIADSFLSQAEDSTNWLALAANQGQNTSPDSFVKKELVKPIALTRASALAGWTVPNLTSAGLTLPSLPENLKVDLNKLRQDSTDDVNRMKDMWIAKFIPDSTDVSQLNDLFNKILNGTQSQAAGQQLDALAAATVAAIEAIKASTQGALNTAIALMKTNLASNFTAAQAQITAANAAAQSNADGIAWARARDRAAREGARLEQEAVSNWASRGFTLPGGALSAIAAKQRQATANAASEMAAQQAEKTQQMFFDLARATIDAWLRQMDAQSQAEIQSFQASTNANLRFAELLLDANKAKAKQAFDHLGLTIDFTKFAGDLAVKYRLGVNDAVNNLVRAYSGLRSNELEYLNAIARAEREAQAALIDYYRAAIASAEVGMRLDLQNNENDIRWATIAAQFIGTAVGHHVQAASSTADVFSRLASSALGGLNGIASVAASG